MPITIRFERGKPIASAEFMVTSRLSVSDLPDLEAPSPRELDFVLASTEFENVLGDVRAFLEGELDLGTLDVVELKGMACHDASVYRPGIRLVVRERHRNAPMSETAREQFTALAERIREQLDWP
ncbi:MAG TPA: hypothetical protein VEJ67_14195 [Candidatus Cybelea sp.]|nr:hypothetical protein [Candidatus Cybelea sp.]